jgi:hypothetical protein
MNVPIKGDAWTHKPDKPLSEATEGDVLLFDYGGVGKDHVALITGFQGSVHEGSYYRPEYIEIIEANYTRCKVTTRRIDWNDPDIKGILSTSVTRL